MKITIDGVKLIRIKDPKRTLNKNQMVITILYTDHEFIDEMLCKNMHFRIVGGRLPPQYYINNRYFHYKLLNLIHKYNHSVIIYSKYKFYGYVNRCYSDYKSDIDLQGQVNEK